MILPQDIINEYTLCYMDKSRIRFIENYLSTFSATHGKMIPFRTFPRQKAFLRALAENRNVVAIKPRQCGITTLTSAWVTAQCVFASPDAPETILCVANKREQAQEIVIKIKDFLSQVPRWFWGDDYYSPDPRSEKNTRDIFTKNSQNVLKLFNGCRIMARASNSNATRGISAVSVLILDEAAFIEDGAATFATAMATMASNPNSKTVMVSTPNGKDELYYTTYRQALNKENNFVAVQFRWYQDPRFNKYLTWKKKDKDSGEWQYDQDPIIDHDGSVKYDEERWERLAHLGWIPTSPWYEEMCKSFNNDTVKIAQELDVSFMGSANNVVAPEFIEQQETLNVREPLEDFRDPIVEEMWFWKKPIEGHRYVCACLPKGEKVLTQRGLVNVEEVEADDLLVTKEGEYTKIKRRMYRDVQDEEIVEIKTYNTIDSTRFTWNHPIWASTSSKSINRGKRHNGKWIERKQFWVHSFDFYDAKEISKNDWVEIPNFYRLNEISEDEMVAYWNENYQTDEFQCPLLSEDFWWYCGMWIAEGYVRKESSYIQTTHHINETTYHNRIKHFLNECLGKNCSSLDRRQCNAHDMVFYSKVMKKFLLNEFGHYAYGKYISEWVKKIPQKYKLQLLDGYISGDGCIQEEQTSISSISKQLLMDVQDILLSCGITSSVSLVSKEKITIENGKKVHRRNRYILKISKTNYKIFQSLLKNEICEEKPLKYNMYFSDDLSKVYIKIKDVKVSRDTTRVYNFETESESHTFCAHRLGLHNCDPSRGISADRTAIEIIDMDGEDENGFPIIEQVAEYIGRKLADDIGGLIYQYATLYNDAYVVIDCTGGCGDPCVLALINMGYKNLYYEDSTQKTYTVQNSTKNYDGYTDKLPGFHFQGNRYPVLASFAGLVRNNEFKIRSTRVISELETWIFKDDTGRMDHMHGSHDDAICSLAMGLFVMKYSYNRTLKAISKGKAMLNAYMSSSRYPSTHTKLRDGEPITPKNGLPFYNGTRASKYNKLINGNYMWLFMKK